jgi:hypothetical protein
LAVDQTLDPLFHLIEVNRRVAARPVGELHGETENWELSRDVAQAGHHVPLAGDGNDGAGPALANDAARELPPRRDEDRYVVTPRDLEDAVERLL